jgi:hypothetical protein
MPLGSFSGRPSDENSTTAEHSQTWKILRLGMAMSGACARFGPVKPLEPRLGPARRSRRRERPYGFTLRRASSRAIR